MRRRTGLAIVLAVLISIVTAAAEVSAYTQSYATFWNTTDLGGGVFQYKYWVVNTGEETWTETSPNTWRVESPRIWDYEVPILTEAAYNSIVPNSIYQPWGWTYEFIDPVANPGIWTNPTNDPQFDNPYRILHWYGDPREDNPIRPQGDISGWGPIDENGCWYEEWCADEFGLQSGFGPALGPDQTSWYLDIWELTRIPGDPDLLYTSNGVGAGGGIPLAALAPQQGSPIPEPSTVLLVGAGLIGLGFWGRKRFSGRS